MFFLHLLLHLLLIILFAFLAVANDSDWPDAPIQLVKPDVHHKKLVLVQENLKYLSQVDAPISVVSVVGPLHSGKSFLMNQLMKKKSGFGVGPSVKPTTMGIWMWGKPAVMQEDKGSEQTVQSGNTSDQVIEPGGVSQNINVIFLDTEGFAANNVSEDYDSKIFAVTTLLSSHLLFNSVKIVNQADIDYLEVLSRQTQLFALRSQMTKSKWLESLNEDLLNFPPLTWVVQDFVQETESGETSTKWLHRLMSAHIRENDDYKLSLLDIFKEVYCHTLFLPATSRYLLKNLNNAAEEDLTPEYRTDRDLLIERIKQNLRPKSRDGRLINGAELSHLLTVLVSAANDGNLTSVPSRWETFMQNLITSSVTACVKYYEDEMKDQINELGLHGCVKGSILVKAHKESLDKSRQLLTNLLKGLPNSISAGQKKLDSLVTLHFEQIQALNTKKVESQVTHIIKEAEIELEKGMNDIRLPTPTKDLELETQKILSPIFARANQLMSRLLEAEQLQESKSSLGTSLSRIVTIFKSKNTQEMNKFLQEMIEGSLLVYNKTIDKEWSRERPLHPSYLNNIKKFADEEANSHYAHVTNDFVNEPLYEVINSHLQQRLRKYGDSLEAENEQLADNFISNSKDSAVAEFTSRTSPQTLQMPLMDDELEERLQRETVNVIKDFKSQTSEFEVYKSYSKTFQSLREQLADICSLRKQENIDAFTKEVLKPLQDSVRLIKISESKYSTVFSFKKYIEEVCLEMLKDGKPATWPYSLKLKIIANFIENNDDLSTLIAQKDSLFSRILGAFEWIWWCISNLFKIIYTLLGIIVFVA